MMTRNCLLPNHLLGGVPAVILYVLRLRIIILFIGRLFCSQNRKLRFRHTDDDLITQMQRRIPRKTRVQCQHLIHIITAAVGNDRQSVSRLYLISLVFLRFLGHRFDGL